MDDDFEKWNENLFRKFASSDRYVHPNFFIRLAANARADSIVRALDLDKGDRVIDVGCGSGFLMKRIRDANVTGVDLSDTALSMARVNLSGMGNVRLVKADARQLPFDDSSFDKVVCADVLEHVPAPKDVVREIKRVSRPGARIVIALPNEALQHNIIRAFSKIGISGLLKGVDSHREWHIHHSGIDFFDRIKLDLKLKKTVRSPSFVFPMTYIFVCERK